MCERAVEDAPQALYLVPDRLKTQEMCEKAVADDPYTLEFVPDHLKTKKMCDGTVEVSTWLLKYVPDHFKTHEMCDKAVKEADPYVLRFVPDHFRMEEMCNDIVEKNSWALEIVPDHFKTQKMWDKTVGTGSNILEKIPERFVRQRQLKIHHNDKFDKWYNGYKKRKAQKAKIKDELMPIAWHPSRWWDWCDSKDEKKETEKLWA